MQSSDEGTNLEKPLKKATFEEFDVNGDGDISNLKFMDALRQLRITDLSRCFMELVRF